MFDKQVEEYYKLLELMLKEDEKKLVKSIEKAKEISKLQKSLYRTISSFKLNPLFEAKKPIANPNNYFQNIVLDEEILTYSFSHGSTTSLIFLNNYLVLFSKHSSHVKAEDFFSHYLLVHFRYKELDIELTNKSIIISYNGKKKMKNLYNKRIEEKNLKFRLVHQNVEGKFTSKERLYSSATFKNILNKYQGSKRFFDEVDMQGYIITVPHFAPHPYMLKLYKEYGFNSKREMQEKVFDYISNIIQKNI